MTNLGSGLRLNAGLPAQKQASNLTAPSGTSRGSVTTNADDRAHAFSRVSTSNQLGKCPVSAGGGPRTHHPRSAPPCETEARHTDQGPQVLPSMNSIYEVGINNWIFKFKNYIFSLKKVQTRNTVAHLQCLPPQAALRSGTDIPAPANVLQEQDTSSDGPGGGFPSEIWGAWSGSEQAEEEGVWRAGRLEPFWWPLVARRLCRSPPREARG